ncbi:MAG: hypothetical protein LW835_03105 [Burkholderiaceae bacterium]|jgi:hypothetical protein|nr:hypothetical protein [Burkholderiaceae bacterium]
MDKAILTPEQHRELALARIRWNLSLAERREITSLVESCAILACDANVEAAEALGLVVELLPSHRATAAQIGQIFRDTYERRRRDRLAEAVDRQHLRVDMARRRVRDGLFDLRSEVEHLAADGELLSRLDTLDAMIARCRGAALRAEIEAARLCSLVAQAAPP